MKFGDIYLLKKYSDKDLNGHYVTVLCVNLNQKQIYFQTLSSRIYKVFPNFGSFTNQHCINCSSHPNLSGWKKVKFNHSFLDVDTVSFLNFRKYKEILNRETFICLKKINKDNQYDFESKIEKGVYQYKGNLLTNNQKSILISMNSSTELSNEEKSSVLDFYKLSLATKAN